MKMPAKKTTRGKSKGGANGDALKGTQNGFARELIIIGKAEAGLRATPSADERMRSSVGADVAPLSELLLREGIACRPVFGFSEERIRDSAASVSMEAGEGAPDLATFYHVDAPDNRLDELAAEIREMDVIDAAYVKPPGEPPRATQTQVAPEPINDMLPLAEEPPATTPDFTARQIYLNAAPAGIDARYAWTIPGGRGAGVKIIDCEWGWRFSHEDLVQNQMGVVVGSASSNDNHGTAVLGEISGDRNAKGVTGICPDAIVGAARFGNSASTIRQAADKLRAGDILLLEIHRAGPRHNFQGRQDQLGYVAIEWWPDDYLAIQYAVSRGIIVVEAAGNGAENLDDAIYNTNPGSPHGPFPSWWRNPFRRNPLDSRAIVVGAGAPPPGTHGRNHGPDRSRLGFSNYGALIDAQGWGREVTSTGYGNLQGGTNTSRDLWYTDTFSGTSSASPIIVGALGCVQGVRRTRGTTLLNPTSARSLLRSSGSPQQDAPGRPKTQRIGNRPNLSQMITPTAARAWHGWENLGGFCTDGVGVSSWAARRLDCFVVGNNRNLYHKWWDGSRWRGWENLSGQLYSAPEAVSWGPNRIDVFGIGRNRAMWHKWWNGSRWSGWENLGGLCTDGVSVSSWAANRLDCFVVGNNRSMYHKWWDGSRWRGWENLGGQIYSAPTAVSWEPNRIDAFALGRNRSMWHRWYS